MNESIRTAVIHAEALGKTYAEGKLRTPVFDGLELNVQPGETVAIVGASGVDLDGSLMDYDYREVRAAQAMMKNARQRYLAVDSSKFGRNAMMKLCHISEVNDVLTDDDTPAELAPILADKNVRLHVARAGEPILPEE